MQRQLKLQWAVLVIVVAPVKVVVNPLVVERVQAVVAVDVVQHVLANVLANAMELVCPHATRVVSKNINYENAFKFIVDSKAFSYYRNYGK